MNQPVVTYCKRWFRAKKCALEIYSTEHAKALHEKGLLYCALIGSTKTPHCFLEVRLGFVGVGFLDDQLHEVVSYQFQEKQPSKLFLTMATYREYEANTDRVLVGTTYLFDESGDLKIRKESFSPAYELTTSSSHVDVSVNWDEFPSFGHYSNLIKVERQ